MHASDLYVTDTGLHTIRKIVPTTGVVTTVAGTTSSSGTSDGTGSSARFNSPVGIASDGRFLWIQDNGNGLLRRFDPKTGEVTTVAGNSSILEERDGSLSQATFPGTTPSSYRPLFFDAARGLLLGGPFGVRKIY